MAFKLSAQLKWIVLMVFLMVGSLNINAQIKSFSEDNVKFIDEMKSFFEAGMSDKALGHDFLKEFETQYWDIGKTHDSKFSQTQKQMCYEVCNLMLKRKLRPLDFKSYLTSMMNFVDTHQSDENFLAWQDCINKILNGKAIKSFTEYLSMSESLFSDNVFYHSPTFEWSAGTGKYEFKYDSVPKVVFPALNLICRNSKTDSVFIANTKGVYYPSTGKFLGSGGRVSWVKAGLDEKQVYADLKNYTITVKWGGIIADSVTFNNKFYFSKVLTGQLTDKALAEVAGSLSYPRFESYNKTLTIKDIAPSVDFTGGFSMRGPKFIGYGNNEQEARLLFRKGDTIIAVAGSKQFFVAKERISSDNASIKIFIEHDSIYHPGLSLKYMTVEKKFSMIRSEDGLAKTPFLNSYHALDMYFEELYWKTDEPQIQFRMLLGNATGMTDFESANYFKADRLEQLQGMDGTNPVVTIKNFVKANKDKRDFTVDALAKFMHTGPEQIRPFLVRIAVMGFLNFDTEKDIIHVKERLFRYLQNSAGKADYDAINFHSVMPGESNGLLNLLNNELTLRGVASIQLSDSQNVVIYPTGKKVVVKKNRDFYFGGRIHAGRFNFYGKTFTFNYDQFKVDIKDADSVKLSVNSFVADDLGEHPMMKVKSAIEHVNGDLLIDHPKNKSGYNHFPQYPVFNSSKDSYVFYQRRGIGGGVYSKDKFYFHLDPFSIDSLKNFSNEGLHFSGEFVSSDIFPKFREDLNLQHDYSLGFQRLAPPEGYPLYGGKGVFKDTIKMSNEGLHGSGVITYLPSTSKSKDFFFYPDSMNGTAQNFDVKQTHEGDIEYPQVKGEGDYIHWVPYADVMHIHSREKEFETYNGQATFAGRYDLVPGLLSGKGKAMFSKGELDAPCMKFKEKVFDADTADFKIQALEEAALAFSTNNVKSHIDFAKREAVFKTIGKGQIVRFPVNQYICYMESMKWFMGQSEIELGGDDDAKKAAGDGHEAGDLDLTGPEFISVHPNQDSLRFNSPRAKYDLKHNVISAMEVKYIKVADARIHPDSGNVVIRKNAAMESFKNAKVVANTVTQYHTIYNANVAINSRKNYNGSGYYDYIDELKKAQTIYFNNIRVDTTFQTVAESQIDDSAHFTLSPNFDFRGKTKLQGAQQFLTFTGTSRLQYSCNHLKRSWFKFTAEIDPNKILIPVAEEPMDDKGSKLGSGVMISTDSTHIYSTFLSSKYGRNDQTVLQARGFLFFDKQAREYKIAAKEKLAERNLPGNYLSLNVDKCLIYGEGKVSLGTDYGQMKTEIVGNISHFLTNDSTSLDLMLTLDFFFDEGAMNKMAESINAVTDLKPIDFTRPGFDKGLREILGKEVSDKLVSQLNLYGKFKKFPDELRKSIFFTELKMKWNQATRSYVSVGRIGLGNIEKNEVNKYVTGKVEFIKKKGGDILNVYIEADKNTWYYFNYTKGLLQAISSVEAFNTVIQNNKAEKRQQKTERGETPFVYNLSSTRKKDDFLKKVGQ